MTGTSTYLELGFILSQNMPIFLANSTSQAELIFVKKRTVRKKSGVETKIQQPSTYLYFSREKGPMYRKTNKRNKATHNHASPLRKFMSFFELVFARLIVHTDCEHTVVRDERARFV